MVFRLPYLPGDIVLFRKRGSLLGALVRRYQTSPSDTARTLFEHVGVMSDESRVVEARHKVEHNPIRKYLYDHRQELLIVRRVDITHTQRLAIADWSAKQVGRHYGYLNVCAHLGDYLLGRLSGHDAFVFRRACRLKNYPICSWLIAWGYWKFANIIFSGVPKSACQPDDIADDVIEHNPAQYRVVHVSPMLYKELPNGLSSIN